MIRIIRVAYLCRCRSRTNSQMLHRITPHASAMAKAHGILGTLGRETRPTGRERETERQKRERERERPLILLRPDVVHLDVFSIPISSLT